MSCTDLLGPLRTLLPNTLLIEAMPVGAASENLLYPDEFAVVAKAVEKRRREFAAGRICARKALVRLGRAACSIPVGAMREPIWPADVTASITHDGDHAMVGMASARDVRLLGIDLAIAKPLGPELRALVCSEDEMRSLTLFADSFSDNDPFKLVFSLKESIYKCLFPVVRKIFDFHDVRVNLRAREEAAVIELRNRQIFGQLDVPLRARFRRTGDYFFTIVWAEHA